eukprot:gene24000-30287_t
MHNQDGAVHGITRFADYSEEDFKKLLGYKAAKSTDVDKAKRLTSPMRPTATTTVDWSGTYTSDVKDQGYCGSCWAFSATEQIESDAIRLGLLTTDETLSEQQIISCDTDDYGCSGGNPLYAYSYVYSNGGVTSEAAYPYSSYYDVSGTCSKNEASTITITSYSLLSSEEDMISYVLSTGPLSVCVDASSWSSYSSGIMSTCGSSVDHCVQAVGISVEDSYWKVRNSWGTEWGESGYIRLKSGVDMCSISYIPSFVVPEAVESSARHAGGQGQHGGRHFIDGIKQGHGIQIYDRKTYTGQWVNDREHGQGVMEFRGTTEGLVTDVYRGSFEHGYMQGEGELIYANGDRYTGHFAGNNRHGQGEMTCVS